MLSVGNYLSISSANVIPNASCGIRPRHGVILGSLNSDVFVRSKPVSFTGSCEYAVSFFEECVRSEKLIESSQIHGLRIFTKPKRVLARVLLLNAPLKFEEAIKKFDEIITENRDSIGIKNIHFLDYKNAVKKHSELRKIKIKGIVGQGAFSTAFLTTDGTIIKLSTDRVFPKKKNFVAGVDAPIFGTYVSKINSSDIIYGVQEPFLKEGSILNIPQSIYNTIYENFETILKEYNRKHNKNYRFSFDFRMEGKSGLRQMGFDENGKPYLMDRQCIENRNLTDTPWE